MRFSVDPWDPEYGAAFDALDATTATVVADLEVPAADWAPRTPPASVGAAERVLFVDGVRRVEARVWIEGPDRDARPGLAASYAAGVVCCDGSARLVDVEVGRGLFSASPHAGDVATRHGRFPARMAAGDDPDTLSLALQARMGEAEAAVAHRVADGDLVVVDGPIRHVPHAVGMVKTHHVRYLDGATEPVVGALEAGQRTPVFTLGTTWSRHSWYVRLPGAEGAPWSGIVRCESSPDLAPRDAVALADLVTATLPRFASETHKEARAPQNLYPIAGLERELRRRLGDARLLYRALRAAARQAA